VALNLEQKKAVVAQVAAVAARAHSVVAAEYAGLSVAQLTELRRRARDGGVNVRVVRNTLARRALQGTDFAALGESLVGPLLLAFSEQDPGAAARVVRDFAKAHDKLVVKLVGVSGRAMGPEALESLATLPTRDEALARLLATMKAPVEKLARALAGPHTKLVRTLAAVRDQKQAA